MVRTRVLKNFDFVIHTDRGRVRDRNEDFLSYADTINGYLFVVCDGMGGHSAGDVASELGVNALKDFLNETYISNPFEALEQAILYANKIIYNQALGNDYLFGMGTTIVAALIRDDRVYYGHAGDSRLYLHRNHVLDQLTEDHSAIQHLMKSGIITAKEALNHPRRHEITRALGLSPAFEPDISPKAIIPQNEDIMMLCTDGLTNMVGDNEIVKILDNPYSMNDKAIRLISRANRNGGQDNISVLLVRFHNLNEQDELPENSAGKPIISRIRALLRKRNFVYFLILLFILSSTFFIFNEKEQEKPEKPRHRKSQARETKADLIIAYKPKTGENLDILSDKFNTGTETILRLNPNFNPNQIGVHIKIPAKALYVYKQTDELEIIAAMFKLPVVEILKANDLGHMYPMVGTELIIPLNKSEQE
jgi:serine/threonine protein phosphatase PrpC/LysM repeat protein